MKLIASLSSLTVGNIAVTLLIQWYVLVVVGPGFETDALFASLTIPQFILSIVGASLMHVLVPVLSTEDEDRFGRSAWGFFIIIGGTFTTLAVILFLTAHLWVPLFVPGFSGEGEALTAELVRIQVVGMVFTALSAVLWASYHARQRFIWGETTPLIGSIVGLGVLIVALPRYGIFAVAWVTVLRLGVQTLLLLPGLGPYRAPDWNDTAFKETWRRIKPLLLGTTYYKTDPIVDRFFSSTVPAGGLSLLSLSQQLYSAALRVANTSLAAPMVPKLATLAEAGEWIRFRLVYRKRLFWMFAVTGAGYLVLLVIGLPILRLLIGRGAVTEANVRQLWLLMVALVGFPMGGAMGQILSATFYAKGNTTTPTKVGILGYTLGIVLKIMAFLTLGLIGIAIGTTLYYFLNVVLMYFLLERELNRELSLVSSRT